MLDNVYLKLLEKKLSYTDFLSALLLSQQNNHSNKTLPTLGQNEKANVRS